jgi:hypothetical protein
MGLFSRLIIRGTRLCILLAIVASASCNYYFNPYADLVLRVTDVEASSTVDVAISRFAQERQLVAWRSDSIAMPESNRRLNEKTTYYMQKTRSEKEASLVYFDASAGCKVVRVVERSPSWTPQSEADLVQLRTALGGITGVTVEMGGKFDQRTQSARTFAEYCPI